MSELRWEKTTFGELPMDEWYAPHHLPVADGTYLTIYYKKNKHQFKSDTPVYRLVSPEREALEKAGKYRKFFDLVVETLMDGGCSLDTDDLVANAEACGLIGWMTYDPNNEVMVDFCSGFDVTPDDGDRFWYVIGADPRIDAIATAALEGR